MFKKLKELWDSFGDTKKLPRVDEKYLPMQWYNIELVLEVWTGDKKPVTVKDKYQDYRVDYVNFMKRIDHLFSGEYWYTGNVLYYQRPKKVIITKATTEKVK